MKQILLISVGTLVVLFLLKPGGAMAASGKCKVVQVDGSRMVIECNEQAKGFVEGNRIKIKTERKSNKNKKN